MQIEIHCNNGISLDFGKGLRLSTIWGVGSYSDNHDLLQEINSKASKCTASEFMKEASKKRESTNVECLFTVDSESLDKDKIIAFLKLIYEATNTNEDSPIAYLGLEDWIDIVQRHSTKM